MPAEYAMVIMILLSWKYDPDTAIQHSSVTLISRDQRVAVSKGKNFPKRQFANGARQVVS